MDFARVILTLAQHSSVPGVDPLCALIIELINIVRVRHSDSDHFDGSNSLVLDSQGKYRSFAVAYIPHCTTLGNFVRL